MPPIYIINLDKDFERMASLAKNLQFLGLNYTRISAIHGKAVPQWEDLVNEKLYKKRNRMPMPRPGEVGCYLSHLKAMKEFMLTGEPWCVILEDDVEVLPECLEVLRALGTQDDWDLAKLFCFHSGMPFRTRAITQKHHLVIHFTRTTSSAAYAINRRAAETLLKAMLPISEQVDHALERPWETSLRVRGVRPMPIILAPVSANTTIGYNETATERRLSITRLLWLFASRANKEIHRFLYALIEAARS
jgi:glycosyl transferase family 25